jgi:hypothetical protein
LGHQAETIRGRIRNLEEEFIENEKNEMVVDGILDPVHPNWNHRLFWTEVDIGSEGKRRGFCKAPRYILVNERDGVIPQRACHLWGHSTGFDAGNSDRAPDPISATRGHSAASANASAPSTNAGAPTNPCAASDP